MLRDARKFLSALAGAVRSKAGRGARRRMAAKDAEISALKQEIARLGGRAPGGADSSPVFFVLGYPKSGTTWLMRMLDAHPEILCKGEGRLFDGSWKRPGLRRKKSDRLASSLYGALLEAEYLRLWIERSVWSREDDADEHLDNAAGMLIDYFLTQELLDTGKRLVGDKSPLLTGETMEEAARIAPRSKVVHIVRDGRDVAVSGVHHTWNFDNLERNPEAAAKRDAFREDPEKMKEAGESIFTEEILGKLASEWSKRVGRAAEDGRSLLGGNYHELRYESLLENPETEMRRLLEFLGAKSDEKAVGRCIEAASFAKLSEGRKRGEEDATSFFRKGVAGDWKNVFTEEDKRIFKREAGDLLIKLGYEKDGGW